MTLQKIGSFGKKWITAVFSKGQSDLALVDLHSPRYFYSVNLGTLFIQSNLVTTLQFALRHPCGTETGQPHSKLRSLTLQYIMAVVWTGGKDVRTTEHYINAPLKRMRGHIAVDPCSSQPSSALKKELYGPSKRRHCWFNEAAEENRFTVGFPEKENKWVWERQIKKKRKYIFCSCANFCAK